MIAQLNELINFTWGSYKASGNEAFELIYDALHALRETYLDNNKKE